MKGAVYLLYENIKRMCFENGTNICNLEKSCGIANGTISKWRKGSASPRFGTMMKIANYFGVSMDELIVRLSTQSQKDDS